MTRFSWHAKETDRVFRLRKSCSFVSFVQKESCKEESCLPLAEIVFIRAVRAERIVQGRIVSSACGNRVHSCRSCKEASCLPLAEIVFFRVVRAERIVPSACGKRAVRARKFIYNYKFSILFSSLHSHSGIFRTTQ